MRRPALLLLLAWLALWPSGCVVVAEPDLVESATYSPSSLPFSGGVVRVRAVLLPGLDGEPVISASIKPASGASVSSVLRLGSEGGRVREALLTVQPNTAAHGAAQTCTVTLEAKLGGTQTLDLGTIALAGVEAPPDAP